MSIKKIAAIAAFILFNISSYAHFGSKGPLGGTVTAFHVLKKKNGSADSVIFAGTANGGVYQSTNGTSWSARPVGLKSGKITALVHTGSYLFAATADSGVFVFTGFTGSDRFWKKVNTGLTNLNTTSLLAIDSITVLVGTNGDGVFKTTNKGKSWTAVNNHLHHLEITALAKKGNRIYATAEGIWGTDNAGDKWFDANDIYTEHIENTNSVSINQTTGDVLLSNADGIFKATISSDTLLDFTLEETGLPVGYEINNISNDANAWYLSTNQGVFVSPLSPIVWTAANTGLKTLTVNAVSLFGTKLIAGTSKTGIYSATQPTASWTVSNTGFNNIETYSVVTNPTDSICIVANEFGVFVSRDIISGTIKPYVQSNMGLIDSLNVTDIVWAKKYVFATTKNGGVFVSGDTCKMWYAANDNLTNLSIQKIYYYNNYLYIIDNVGAVYQTQFNGMVWTNINYDLPVGNQASSLTFFGNKILLTSKNNGVFVKSLTGNSWTAQNTGLANLKTTSSTISKNMVFVGTHGNGVFVADTANFEWTATVSKPKGAHTDSVNNNYYVDYIQSMLSNGGYVFAAYKGGIFATSDNGNTWVPGGNQFNFPTYSDINKISISKGRVFVTTENNSVYSNALSELPPITVTSIETSNIDNSLNIYPNPNSGKFTVELGNELSNIEIYDLAGTKVYSLNQVQNTQTISLPNIKGIFVVKISSNSNVKAYKVVVE